MKQEIEAIIAERKNCCNKVQCIIDKHCKASMTEMKFRNLLQMVLKDEIRPKNSENYYIEFDKQYRVCSTVKEIKQALITNITQGVG